MATGHDPEGEARIDERTDMAALGGKFGERGGDIERGKRFGDAGKHLRFGKRGSDKVFEKREFDFDGAAGRFGDAAGQRGQLRRREAHGVRHGLAVDIGAGKGRLRQLLAMTGRHLDVIAEHIVVADLERGDAGFLRIFRLKTGDELARVVAQAARLVELRARTPGDEAAVAGDERQFAGQHHRETLLQGQGGLVHGGAFMRNFVRQGQKRGGRGVERAAKLMGGGKPVPHGGEIARAAAAEREARQGAGDIGGGFEAHAEITPHVAGIQQPFDGVEAAVDGGGIGQGRGEAAAKLARARTRHRAVDDGEERACRVALKGADEFEIGAGRRVDRHGVGAGDTAGRGESRHAADLGELDIIEEGAHGAELRAGKGPEAIQCRDGKMTFQAAFRIAAVETGGRQERQCRARMGQAFVCSESFRDEKFAGRESRELGAQTGGRNGGDGEFAGRNIRPGKAEIPFAAGFCHSGEIVMRAGIEQRVLGERAGGDEAADGAGDDGFAAAFLRLRRVLRLLADGDLEALADEALQIGLVAVNGDAAHGNVLAQMLAALRQRDVERARGRDGIVEEEFVEIAHPVEEERIRPGALDLQILRHHWGRLPRGGRRGRRRRERILVLEGGGGAF